MTYDTRITQWEAEGIWLLRDQVGLGVFDGEDLRWPASLSLEAFGTHPTLQIVGPAAVLDTREGVFRLHPDASVERLHTYPTSRPSRYRNDIAWLAAAETFIIVGNGEVWQSDGLEVFEQIKTPETITSYIAPFPGQPAALLNSETGVLVLDLACQ